MVPDADERIDGRTARRDRNVEAVLDAALDLFRAGVMAPGLADVAERAGVSTRSVQRYFADMDDLTRAAIARHLQEVGPLLEIPDLGVGPQEGRIERLVTGRLRLYEAVAPMVRAALQRIQINEIIRDRILAGRALMRSQVATMFAPELDALAPEAGHEVLDALDALLGFDSLEFLRVHLGRSEPEAVAALQRAVRALLRPEA